MGKKKYKGYRLSYHLFEFAAQDLESDVKCQSQSKVPGTTEETKKYNTTQHCLTFCKCRSINRYGK